MDKKIIITYNNNEEVEVKVGTSLKELSQRYQDLFNDEILLAKVDNELAELSETITHKCNVTFYDRSSFIGNSSYISSATFIFILAVKRVLGNNAKVVIRHSLENGVLCSIDGIELNSEMINNIKEEMNKIVKEDILFQKISVSRTDSIKYFKNKGQFDKVNLLKYISNTYINLYRIDNEYNYFHTKLVYSTGQIRDFDIVYLYDNFLALIAPNLLCTNKVENYKEHRLTLDAYKKALECSNKLGVCYLSDINKTISNAKTVDLIQISEAYYENQLQRVAADISKHDNIKLVLLAGPSSSGKTTTAKKIMNYLKSNGQGVLQISVDNYYHDLEHMPKDEKGDYDFESLEAIDIELLNKDINSLMEGKEVVLPTFNFLTGNREYRENAVRLKENEIMVIEGIHCINEQLTYSIDSNLKYKIYISPLVNIRLDDQNYIHTTDVRKLRRIIRDSRTRGKSASKTLQMWSSVRRGEEKYIYPYQDDVNMVINSFLFYEIGLLKTYVEPLLFSVEESDENYPEALRLINFLRNALPISSDNVPVDSLLREFIGGSCFED